MAEGSRRVGLVGGRGHTGRELINLLEAHPRLQLVFAGSRELAGQPVAKHADSFRSDLCFEEIGPDDLAGRDMDACVLALPNGVAEGYVAVLEERGADVVILDLSADYRFDDDWHYGLPELTRERSAGKTRIANPGCYATALQLALAPALDLLSGAPACFGVSGYSGAGTRPSPRNDLAVLAHNLLPYHPVGHVHEREVSRQLGREVHFTPHVAEFFRGISTTAHLPLKTPISAAALEGRYRQHYEGEPLIELSEGIPLVADNAHRHHAAVGGWHVAENRRHAVVFSTLDNLLKGAATQAVQNLNLAFGWPETEGIAHA